jgi:TRAP-type C4-dicarboxylate transport system permease small subunit
MKRSREARRGVFVRVLVCALVLAAIPMHLFGPLVETVHDGLITLFQASASYIYLVLVVALGIAAFAFLGVATICRKSSELR